MTKTNFVLINLIESTCEKRAIAPVDISEWNGLARGKILED